MAGHWALLMAGQCRWLGTSSSSPFTPSAAAAAVLAAAEEAVVPTPTAAAAGAERASTVEASRTQWAGSAAAMPTPPAAAFDATGQMQVAGSLVAAEPSIEQFIGALVEMAAMAAGGLASVTVEAEESQLHERDETIWDKVGPRLPGLVCTGADVLKLRDVLLSMELY